MNRLEKSMWVECKINPASNAYNAVFIFQFNLIDRDRLLASLQALHKRYQILNKRFCEENAKVTTYVETNKIQIESLQSINELVESMYAPINLLTHQLFRYAIVQTNNSSYVGFCWHHIIIDALSITILMKFISEHYAGKSIPVFSHSNFIPNDLSDWWSSKFIDRDRESSIYWTKQLANIEPFLLGIKNNTIGKNNASGHRLVFSLLPQYASNVMNSVSSFKTTLFIYLTAIVSKILSELLTVQKIILGYTHSLRDKITIDCIGYFAAQYLMVLNRSDNLIDYIEQIKKILLWNASHNKFVLADILRIYREVNRAQRAKLFNVSLNYGTYFALGTEELKATPYVHQGFHISNDLIIRFEYYFCPETKLKTILFEIDFNKEVISTSFAQILIRRITSTLG